MAEKNSRKITGKTGGSKPRRSGPKKKTALINPAAKNLFRDEGTTSSFSVIDPAMQTELNEVRSYMEIQEKVNRGLRAFINEMTIVFRFIETVSTIHSYDRILQFLMDVLKELCGYDSASLYLYQAGDTRSESHSVLDYAGTLIARYRRKLDLDERIFNWVFRQGHAVVVPESFVRPGQKGGEKWSFMIAPLMTASEKLGRIELFFKREQGTFTQQTFSILNVLIKHAAVILANERVYLKEKATAKKYIELDMLKQDVVNTTTHEIKTPLTIIQASSILLERNQAIPPEERIQLLKKISGQCERINQIVVELFESSQMDESKPVMNPEVVALNVLTREIIQDIPYNAEKIVFQILSEKKLGAIWADRSRIYKVIRNLVENAVKYSPQGGTLTIKTRQSKTHVFWEIQDQGVGISPEDQEKVFEKFYRAGASTTRSVRGMGFGLYLAKKNVELNQGSITLKSQLGKGSLFSLQFPRYIEKEKNHT
ncbi:GAF domain-containing sensor histidine kinase [bacterium]|nr:GAF domain-containing sensor histidine kinase [bacterium]